MIHPLIRMKAGTIKAGRFYLGSRESAWKKYISSELRSTTQIDKRYLFVTYVGLTQRELEIIKKEVERRSSFDNLYICKASPAIAVNCGPGTFGLLWMSQR